jgi:hypothetical protein
MLRMSRMIGIGTPEEGEVAQSPLIRILYRKPINRALCATCLQCNARIAASRVSMSARKSVLPTTDSTIGTIISG